METKLSNLAPSHLRLCVAAYAATHHISEVAEYGAAVGVGSVETIRGGRTLIKFNN